MFSGIIEAKSKTIACEELDQAYRLTVQRPNHFDDLHHGDSVAVDGVCLTVENFAADKIIFVVGFETMRVLGWTKSWIENHIWNLERSMKIGERLHGHFVSGHVEAVGRLVYREKKGESLILQIQYPQTLAPLLWQKGSVAVNGVSLTINELDEKIFSVCLIPETIERTNLGTIKNEDPVSLEPDMMARALLRHFQLTKGNQNVL